MLGLLKKDIFTLAKQLKLFLAIIVIWSLIPGFSVTGFAIIYAGLLPITAAAYDERSKWNTYASMMPYSAFDLVFSKYLLGYTCILIASVLSVLSQYLVSLFTGSEYSADGRITVILIIAVAVIILAVNLPFMLLFGVEKGRMFFFLLIFASTFAATTLGKQNNLSLGTFDFTKISLICIVLLAAIVINIISVFVTTKLYEKKVFP